MEIFLLAFAWPNRVNYPLDFLLRLNHNHPRFHHRHRWQSLPLLLQWEFRSLTLLRSLAKQEHQGHYPMDLYCSIIRPR